MDRNESTERPMEVNLMEIEEHDNETEEPITDMNEDFYLSAEEQELDDYMEGFE